MSQARDASGPSDSKSERNVIFEGGPDSLRAHFSRILGSLTPPIHSDSGCTNGESTEDHFERYLSHVLLNTSADALSTGIGQVDQSPFFDIRPVCTADKSRFESLFELNFQAQISDGIWRWKYSDPSQASIIAFHNAEPAGFYGAIPRNWFALGERLKSVQICDVMVSKQYRGILTTRRGLLAQMASSIRDVYIGSLSGAAFGFGFPNDRHLRLGVKLALYREAEKLKEMRWQSIDSSTNFPWVIQEIKESDPLISVAGHLWPQMKEGFNHSLIAERDPKYLVHRFLEHPVKTYKCYSIRNICSRDPEVLVILQKEDAICRLVDIIGNPRSMPAGIHAVRRISHQIGCSQVLAWGSHFMVDLLKEGVSEITHEGPSFALMTTNDALETRLLAMPTWVSMADADFT